MRSHAQMEHLSSNVSDNTGHDLATLDGQNTYHALGTIAIANGKCIKLFNSTTKTSAR